ncbi:coiled-coil domain-containing protein CG32809-like isoform X4 [Mytilus edulis]|uniref:coiled-coil domain-containing protein CG32809-like isoform X4 n=1 Tax=Mytilus edulis TaxID=6550 RepID=UPI0039EE62B2
MEEYDRHKKSPEKSKIPTLFKKSKTSKQKKSSPKRSSKDAAHSRSASLSPRLRHGIPSSGPVSPYKYCGDYTARKIYGSAENVKGNNYEDLDSFWDVSMTGIHVRSKSQPRSAPGSNSLQRKVQQPEKQVPRRHTLGGSAFRPPEDVPVNVNGNEDDSRKREQFMDMLAKRYPKYAEKISGTSSEDGYPIRPHARRPRDPHRRATVVTYNPANVRDYEDFETMSNVEGPVSFQRGSFMRNSLPIVRSPPNTYDRAMGMVFLVYQDETKKSDLPNEITHLDTVRALFVRSFQEKLNMEYLSSPRRKIYILDPRTSIYYQLEDLRDIKDRTVLKLLESDSDNPQKVREVPPEKRGKRSDQGIYETPATAITDQVRKAQTLPASMSHSYPVYRDPIYASDYDIYRSPTPDLTRSAPSHHPPVNYAHNALYDSPDRIRGDRSTPDRHNLGPIPENIQMQNGYVPVPQTYQDHDGRGRPTYRQQGPQRGPEQHYRSVSPPVQRSQLPPGDPLRRTMSPTPGSGMQIYDYLHGPGGAGAPGAPPQTYIAKGVRANTMVSPLRASGPPPDTRHQPNRHSLAFTPMSPRSADQPVQRSQSYRITPEREQVPMVPPPPRSITPSPTTDPETRVRMEKMEVQLANLTAWVQTAVVTGSSRESSIRSGASTTPSDLGDSKPPSVVGSISDISSQSSHHTIVTQSIKDGILNVARQTSDLKVDLKHLRRIQQLNNESMTDSIQETIKKISKVLTTVPGAEHQVLRQQRSDIDTQCKHYKDDGSKVLRELGDLESSVEEMREDVISRQCRVNLADVEGMALVLSHVTKHLGELRCRFPGLQDHMKKVMSGEMEVVIKEEKFLKDEPDRIEEALKRCKRLTGTLFTLKRLASAQEQRPLHVPSGDRVGGRIATHVDRKELLDNIQAVVPDHQSRLQSIKAADASRERKKKIITQQEALKFGKSLEKATKALKSAAEKEYATKPKSKVDTGCASKGHCEGQDSKPDPSCVIKPQSTSETPLTTKFSVPLTSSTTEKIVLSSSTKGSDGATQRKQIDEKIVRTTSDTKVPPSSLSSTEEENIKRSAAKLSIQKNAARAAFFSSLTTPPTSPSEEKKGVSPDSRDSPTRTTMDYTVRISPCRSTVSGATKYIVKDSTNIKSSSSATRPTAKVSFSSPSSSSSSSDSSPSPNSPILVSARASNIPRFSARPETESREKFTYQKEATVQKPSILKSSGSRSDQNKSKEVTLTGSDKNISFEDKQGENSRSSESILKISDQEKSKEISPSNVQTVPRSQSETVSSPSNKPDVRPKKIPPPPPPRRSSKLVRSGPGLMSPVGQDESKSDIHDSIIVAGNNDGTVKSATTCTSTPKPAIPQKPSRITRDRILSDQSKQTVEKNTNLNGAAIKPKSSVDVKKDSDELGHEDREGSIDSSASSSSSSESQQSVVEKDRSTATTPNGGPSTRKPKPPPPVRKSSLADSFEEKSNSGKTDDVNKS